MLLVSVWLAFVHDVSSKATVDSGVSRWVVQLVSAGSVTLGALPTVPLSVPSAFLVVVTGGAVPGHGGHAGGRPDGERRRRLRVAGQRDRRAASTVAPRTSAGPLLEHARAPNWVQNCLEVSSSPSSSSSGLATPPPLMRTSASPLWT